MIRKLTLVVAFGAGYVLGAKAGQERYAQINAGVKDLLAKPSVRSATDKVSAKATEVAEQAKDKATTAASDAVESVKDKVTAGHGEDVDLTESTTRSS